MKDIKHYFTDNMKCEASSNNSMEVKKHSPYTVVETTSESSRVKKRNRVKIKISRKDSIDSQCQIIESKHDEIDKTPSPFSKSNCKHQKQQYDTPKSVSPLSTSTQFVKNSQVQEGVQILRETIANSDEEVIANESDRKNVRTRKNLKSKRTKKENSESTVLDDATICENLEEISGDSHEKAKGEHRLSGKTSDLQNGEDFNDRRESNAFDVLMTRNKPIQYISQSQISDEESMAKKIEERKKLYSNKEKLVALANKKGYAKRKLIEMEEADQIENTIQNRIKLFKSTSKIDNNKEPTVIDCKNSPSSLLNYFSKVSAEESNENMLAISTIIVKADVHVSEPSKSKSPVNNTLKKLSSKKSNKCKHNYDMQYVDHIQLLASEQLPPNFVDDKNQVDCEVKRTKPHWSLRIKLHASEDDALSGEVREDRSSPLSSRQTVHKRKHSETSNFIATTNSPRKQNNNSSLNKSQGKKESRDLEPKPRSMSKSNLTKNNAVSTKISINKDSTITGKDYGCEVVNICEHEPSSLYSKGDSDIEEVTILNVMPTSKNIIDSANTKRKSQDKLAPLFTKKYKTDPAAVAARRSFLKSDVMEKVQINKNIDQKVADNGTPSPPFPLISHITQLTNDAHIRNIYDSVDIKFKKVATYKPSINEKNYRFISDFNTISTNLLTHAINKTVKENVEEVLTEMESRCPDARQIWQNINSVTKGDSTISPKSKTRRTRRNDKKLETPHEKNLTSVSAWTYKYKPISTTQIIGNEEAALKLREWLSKWTASSTKQDHSSGDEFYSSDCSIASSVGNTQVAVLLGPHGSGKTASVYAVATELGYSVLEVNASSKRHGKKILKDFEEATKSHRVRKEHGGAIFGSIRKDEITKKIPQNSLILFEDIDLIFEEDEGFISAVYQLVSNTKRPIVLTCKDVCPYLNKMAPEQNRIYYHTIVGNKVLALLELISLAETGSRIPRVCLMDLLRTGDLRKALLQLQYLLLSKLPVTFHKTVIGSSSIWQDMRRYLYKPAIKMKKQKKKIKKKSTSTQIESSQDHLNTLAEDIDSMSIVSALIQVEDLALDTESNKPQPSLSLIEDTTPYYHTFDVKSEIADWIGYSAMYKNQVSFSGDCGAHDTMHTRKQVNRGVDLALSHATPASSDHQALSVDYLPYIRAICRIEESRAALNSKRGNRFFHYLYGLKLPSASTKPNILAAACKMMQDKQDRAESSRSIDIS